MILAETLLNFLIYLLFQIDGNSGGAIGIIECLMQNQTIVPFEQPNRVVIRSFPACLKDGLKVS